MWSLSPATNELLAESVEAGRVEGCRGWVMHGRGEPVGKGKGHGSSGCSIVWVGVKGEKSGDVDGLGCEGAAERFT